MVVADGRMKFAEWTCLAARGLALGEGAAPVLVQQDGGGDEDDECEGDGEHRSGLRRFEVE
jgi:hypothetical protein